VIVNKFVKFHGTSLSSAEVNAKVYNNVDGNIKVMTIFLLSSSQIRQALIAYM